MKIGDRRRDAQPETAAGNAIVARGAVESLEYLVALPRLDSRSGVADANDRSAGVFRQAKLSLRLPQA